jgi:hypothetical protein
MRLVRVLDSKPLQGPQVIAVAKLVEEFLLDGPILVAAPGSEFPLDVPFKIGLDPVVRQQSVVNVHQENN